MTSPATPLLELRQLTKRFPGVTALNAVDLAIEPGEVHVLVGENGAGKSSLVKVLAGIYLPDEGELLLEGHPYRPRQPADALRSGIRVVHQELNLLPYLSVAENLLFEHLPRRHGLVDYPTLYQRARALLDEVGLAIPPQIRVEQLGIAQMQLIEIARALAAESKLLILDEPSATLTPPEIERLFAIIRRLKARGVTFIYISHRLHEVAEIGDRVTVLRNGQRVLTQPVSGLSIAAIVRSMVGHDVGAEYPFRPHVAPGPELLRVADLRRASGDPPINLSVRRGEILGIAGLVGSGRTEVMRAVFGADPRAAGAIFIDGREVRIASPRDAVAHGLCLLTEDRKSQGLLLDLPLATNVTITDLAQVSRHGLLQHFVEQHAGEEQIRELRIKASSARQLPRTLSGGNQQKVVLAKWLFRGARVLIVDEPTRGIDVGARAEIYELLWDLAEQGRAIIVVSSDLPELMGICHRIVVFSRGVVAGTVERPAFDQQQILALAYQEYVRHEPAEQGHSA